MNLLNAFQLLNVIREDKEDYLEKYKQYVLTHKKNVEKFFNWLKENCPDIFEGVNVNALAAQIREHDESKFSEEEFEPYANFWYNDTEHYDYDPAYEAAWEHHYMTNGHHPEHWDGEDMPLLYILEMICDWGSFSINTGNLNELIEYYYEEAKEDSEKNLSDTTQEIIEDILSRINSVINAGE